MNKFECSHSQINGCRNHTIEAPTHTDAALAFVREFGRPEVDYHVAVVGFDRNTRWVLVRIPRPAGWVGYPAKKQPRLS